MYIIVNMNNAVLPFCCNLKKKNLNEYKYSPNIVPASHVAEENGKLAEKQKETVDPQCDTNEVPTHSKYNYQGKN